MEEEYTSATFDFSSSSGSASAESSSSPAMKRAKLDLLAPSDEEEDEEHDSTIIKVVDPIAVARKTLHTESENEDKEEEEDCKPAAVNTTISRKTNNNNTEHDTKDRLSNLNPDLLCKITSFLDPTGLLLQLGPTNRFYHHFCRQNRAGWEALCQQEWHTKSHVLSAARREPRQVPRLPHGLGGRAEPQMDHSGRALLRRHNNNNHTRHDLEFSLQGIGGDGLDQRRSLVPGTTLSQTRFFSGRKRPRSRGEPATGTSPTTRRQRRRRRDR